MSGRVTDTTAPRSDAAALLPAAARPGWLVPAGLGVACGLALCLAPAAPTKVWAVLVGAAACAALLPVASYFPRLVEELALFALSLTLSVSLKFHPVFRPDHIGGAIGLRVSITDLLLALLAVAIVARKTRAGTLRLEADSAILGWFVAYWLLAAASTLAGSDPQLGVFQLVACLQSFAAFVFLVSYLTTRRRLVIFLAALLVALCLQSVVAVVQTRFPDWQALQALGAPEEQELDLVDGRVSLPDVDLGTTFVQGEVQRRPAGLLIHPNVLAFYLILGTTTALGVFLGSQTPWLSSLALLSAALAGLALYVSLSRSGWAGTAFAVVLAAVLGRSALRALDRRRALVLAALGLAVCALAAAKADRIYSRIADTADEAIEFRRNLAGIALRMIAAHPFAGVGLNGFEEASSSYDPSGEQRLKRFPVHNVYLLEASEVGVPGGLAFVATVFFVVVRTQRAAARCASGVRLLPLMVACGIAGFWFAQVSDFVYRIPILTTILWSQVALAFASARVMTSEGHL
jgi:O-Antigen ligase